MMTSSRAGPPHRSPRFREKLGLIPRSRCRTLRIRPQRRYGTLPDLRQHAIENQTTRRPAVARPSDRAAELHARFKTRHPSDTAPWPPRLRFGSLARPSRSRAQSGGSAVAVYFARGELRRVHDSQRENDGTLPPFPLPSAIQDPTDGKPAHKTSGHRDRVRTTRWIRQQIVGSALVIALCTSSHPALSTRATSIAAPVRKARVRPLARATHRTHDATSEDRWGPPPSMQRIFDTSSNCPQPPPRRRRHHRCPPSPRTPLSSSRFSAVQYSRHALIADRMREGRLTVRVEPRTDRVRSAAHSCRGWRVSEAMPVLAGARDHARVDESHLPRASLGARPIRSASAQPFGRSMRFGVGRSERRGQYRDGAVRCGPLVRAQVVAALREMAARYRHRPVTAYRRGARVWTALLSLNASIEAAALRITTRLRVVRMSPLPRLRSGQAARDGKLAESSEQSLSAPTSCYRSGAVDAASSRWSARGAASTQQCTYHAGDGNDERRRLDHAHNARPQQLAATASEMAGAAQQLQAMLARFKTA